MTQKLPFSHPWHKRGEKWQLPKITRVALTQILLFSHPCHRYGENLQVAKITRVGKPISGRSRMAAKLRQSWDSLGRAVLDAVSQAASACPLKPTPLSRSQPPGAFPALLPRAVSDHAFQNLTVVT